MLYYQRESLIIADSKTEDHGIYSCHLIDNLESERTVLLNLSFPVKLVEQSQSPARVKIGSPATLSCLFEGSSHTYVM